MQASRGLARRDNLGSARYGSTWPSVSATVENTGEVTYKTVDKFIFFAFISLSFNFYQLCESEIKIKLN